MLGMLYCMAVACHVSSDVLHTLWLQRALQALTYDDLRLEQLDQVAPKVRAEKLKKIGGSFFILLLGGLGWGWRGGGALPSF